jgi:hypothetical protein
MSQAAGISQAEARSIAQSVVAPVERQVDRLESQVANLVKRVSHLEEELSAIGNAISRMHSDVVSSLKSGFSSVSQEIDQQRQEVVGQTKRVETAVEIGLAATTAATAIVGKCVDTVGDKVDKGTMTSGELEYLRVFNDARAPLKQIEAFQLEIGERFKKSLESVGEERLRNDALFAKVTENLDRKMRTIGEHIFKIYEQDFAHAVAEPLALTRLECHEPALAIDDERIEARARALNLGLERAFQEVIEPLLEMQRRLEESLKSDVAIDGVEPGDFSIPMNAVLTAEGIKLQHAPEAAALAPIVERTLGDPRTLATRSISQGEYDAIALALRDLAKRGVLGPEDPEVIIAAIARDGFFVAGAPTAGAAR